MGLSSGSSGVAISAFGKCQMYVKTKSSENVAFVERTEGQRRTEYSLRRGVSGLQEDCEKRTDDLSAWYEEQSG